MLLMPFRTVPTDEQMRGFSIGGVTSVRNPSADVVYNVQRSYTFYEGMNMSSDGASARRSLNRRRLGYSANGSIDVSLSARGEFHLKREFLPPEGHFEAPISR